MAGDGGVFGVVGGVSVSWVTGSGGRHQSRRLSSCTRKLLVSFARPAPRTPPQPGLCAAQLLRACAAGAKAAANAHKRRADTLMPSAAPAENLGGGPPSRSGRPTWKRGSAPPYAGEASRAPNTGWKKNIFFADPLDALPTRRRRPVARAGLRPHSPASGDPPRGRERGAPAARRLHLGSRQGAPDRGGASEPARGRRTSHRPQLDDRGRGARDAHANAAARRPRAITGGRRATAVRRAWGDGEGTERRCHASAADCPSWTCAAPARSRAPLRAPLTRRPAEDPICQQETITRKEKMGPSTRAGSGCGGGGGGGGGGDDGRSDRASGTPLQSALACSAEQGASSARRASAKTGGGAQRTGRLRRARRSHVPRGPPRRLGDVDRAKRAGRLPATRRGHGRGRGGRGAGGLVPLGVWGSVPRAGQRLEACTGGGAPFGAGETRPPCGFLLDELTSSSRSTTSSSMYCSLPNFGRCEREQQCKEQLHFFQKLTEFPCS